MSVLAGTGVDKEYSARLWCQELARSQHAYFRDKDAGCPVAASPHEPLSKMSPCGMVSCRRSPQPNSCGTTTGLLAALGEDERHTPHIGDTSRIS